MANGAVVSDCSSPCFTSFYQSNLSDSCENCKASKCELQKTHDELKSAQLIIDLLVKEVNFIKASTGASMSNYQRKYNGANFRSDEKNVAGANKWIPVTGIHSNTVRRKHTQQSNNLITLSNSFEVLGNLHDSSEKATTNIPKVHNTLRVQSKRPNTSKKQSVLLVGDSHISGVAERLSFKLGSSFCTIGYVKPNANLNHITSLVKSEFKNLSKSDVVVLFRGTLDVVRNDTMKGLSSVSQFVKNNEHTNMIVVDTPHRFDLATSSCVNKEVIAFNRKLKKIIKPYDHTNKLNLNMERQHFTQHGLHMNVSGKDRISGLLASTITKLVTTHPLETPLPFPGRLKPQKKIRIR
jgi:hypothetical protein